MFAITRSGLLALGLAVSTPLSVAAKLPTPVEQAGKLYGEGVELFKAGKFNEAAEKFQAAYNLDPSPILLYNLARAAEEMGDAEGAIGHYRAYLTRFPQAEDRDEVERRIRILEAVLRNARLATLKVAALPEGATVTLDGEPAPATDTPGSWRLDPGTYTVQVVAEGAEPWTREVTLEPGGEQAVTYEETVAPPPPPPEEPAGGISAMQIAGWSSVGAGAVAIGLGGFFYSQAFAASDDFDSFTRDLPAGVTAVEIESERDSAQEDIDANGTLAYVMWGVGAAAVATGVTLLVLDRDDDTRGTTALVPLPGGMGLTATF